MNCRLCDRIISGKNGIMLYDFNENVETLLGRKISIILNSTEKFENLSNYCCSICSYKIEICFSLLVEIQASDEVIRQTYENLENGKKIDTKSQLFICGECEVTVYGIKAFIQHYESHIMKKTRVGSKRNTKMSKIHYRNLEGKKIHFFRSEENEDSSNSLQGSINMENKNALEKKDVEINLEKSTSLSVINADENDFDIDSDFPDSYDDGNGDVSSDNLECDFDSSNDSVNDLDLNSLYEQKLLSPEEVFDDDDNDDDDDDDDDDDEDDYDCELQSTVQMPDSEYNKLYSKSKNKIIINDLSNFDAQSDDSFSSDSSYTNLVNIVKKELEKSDSEDDSMELTPNENGNYKCETCNVSFKYKFILKLHFDKKHKAFHELDIGNINYIKKNLANDYNFLLKCYFCKTSFPMAEIKNHVLKCRKEYYLSRKMICQICGNLFSFRDLENHIKEHSQTVWACEWCGKKFKAKRFLRSHLGEHDESKKKICEICGKKLLPLSFFSHVMKHKEKRYICQYCGKAFTYNYGLRLHQRVHDSKRLEERPEKKRHKIFCWLCKKDFDCTITLNKHLKNEHNAKGIEQDSRFPCARCDKKFADMFSLKAHLKLIHEMKDEDIARLKSLPVYRYIECNVCCKVFNSENKIRIHMKQEHGLKPFEMEILKKECEKCGKKFASKQNLIHHINGAHLHIKPMTCDICQEKFAKHSSLIYHKLRHSGEKPFQCEFCQKSYRQRNDVIRHLARHVRDKELTLEEASAVNNSPSRLVIKRRIFLKDSSINYKTIVKKNRRKSNYPGIEPILEEEVSDIQEEQMEFNENGVTDSMIYVEEVPVDENQRESPSGLPYINNKPIYDEERNTIILSSPDIMKNSVKNVSYRYIPSTLKNMPAVIVKKQEQL